MTQDFPLTPLVLRDGSIETPGTMAHSPYTVGRLPDRDLVLSQLFISRKHAEIIYENGAFFVVDLDSRHGVYVNGKLRETAAAGLQ